MSRRSPRIAPAFGSLSLDTGELASLAKRHGRARWLGGSNLLVSFPDRHTVLTEGEEHSACGYVRYNTDWPRRKLRRDDAESLLRGEFGDSRAITVDSVDRVVGFGVPVLLATATVGSLAVVLAETIDIDAHGRRFGAFVADATKEEAAERLRNCLDAVPDAVPAGLLRMPIAVPRRRGDRIRERVTATVLKVSSQGAAPHVGVSAWRDSTFERGAALADAIDAGFEEPVPAATRPGNVRIGTTFHSAKAFVTKKSLLRGIAALSSAGRPNGRHLGVYVVTSLTRKDIDFPDPLVACAPYTTAVSPWQPEGHAERPAVGEPTEPHPEDRPSADQSPVRQRQATPQPVAVEEEPVEEHRRPVLPPPVVAREVPVDGGRPVQTPTTGPLLAIDFGTTFTSAAVRDGARRVTTIAFDNGQTRVPSGVLHQPGSGLVVGTLAESQAAMHPAAYEATPKRRIGQDTVTLAGEPVEVVDLVAAVLRHAAGEARRQHGDDLPIVLTHPAEWRSTRVDVLTAAASTAGLGAVRLVPEPVAAAAAYASDDDTPVGAVVAVYDLGGGTFDAAVVERGDAGWEVAGPPAGIDPLGGVDFDRLLFDHVGEIVAGRHDEVWASLREPPDLAWRRHRRDLQREVRLAKEALSSHESWPLYVPGTDETVTVTVSEFEDLIAPLVDRTVELLVATVRQAGLSPDRLAGVYLTGGSSRIPLVHRRVWDAVGIEPRTGSDPKLVVVTGAVA